MGFADSAIAIIKSNRKLQKRNLNPGKKQVSKNQTFNRFTPRIRLTETSLKRVRIKQARNLVKDVLILLIVITVSIWVMDLMFF